MIKTAVKCAGAAALVLALQGCALFSDPKRAEVGAPPVAAAASAPYLASAGPVGLVRCKTKRLGVEGCWRRGDVHTLYPSDEPGGVDTASVAYDTPVPASALKQ